MTSPSAFFMDFSPMRQATWSRLRLRRGLHEGLSHSASLLRPARRLAGRHAPAFVLRLPLPTRHHPACRVDVSSLHAQLPGYRGLLAERGITVSHETIRRWVLAFGPTIARRLRAGRLKPHSRWHIDESGDRGERGCPCPQSHAETGTPNLRQRHLNSTGPASVRPLPRSMQHSRSERLS